nr:zinc finger BED domain-containing protein RICESLEEPER 2-like [Ipomoea batatas]GMD93436.1 zinc finger BED domain-containing protein RICESLEEPER 2-like [Ipomoea batatas]
MISHCFTDICTIEANLNAFINSKDVNMSSMAYEMKKKFDKYWEELEINKLLIVSSVLDPRSKMSFVTICFERLYGKDTPKCMEMKEAIVEVLRKFESVLDVGVTIGDVVPIPNLFTTYTNMVREKGNVEKTSNELDIYLMENIEMPTPNRLSMQFNILSWWRKESMKFPILSEMARDILAIPVSSVASESAFSTSGRILDQYRSSLTPYMVEALILTQDWLRSSLHSDATVSLVQILEETEFMDLLAEVAGAALAAGLGWYIACIAAVGALPELVGAAPPGTGGAEFGFGIPGCMGKGGAPGGCPGTGAIGGTE